MRKAQAKVASRSIQNFRQWLNKSEPTEWLGQIVALTGALLGITTWLYKELIVPNTAPVNIDLTTEVKSLTADNETRDSGSRLDSAIINVTVKNPSPRKITLYGPRWILLGRRRNTRLTGEGDIDPGTENYMVDRQTARDFNQKQLHNIRITEEFSSILMTQNPDSLRELTSMPKATKNYKPAKEDSPTRWELIAVGPLFGVREMEGRATVTSQKAVFFAGSRYDMVESKILIPTTPSDSKIIRSSALGYEALFCDEDNLGFCNQSSNLGDLKNPQVRAFLFQGWCFRPPYLSRFQGPNLSLHDLVSLYSLERLGPPVQQGVNSKREPVRIKQSKYCPTGQKGPDGITHGELGQLTSDEIKFSPKDMQSIGAQVFSTSLQMPTQKMTPSLK